ncbi:vacuolar protein sorting-associated protein VTA1 homolog isoform X2 [Chelonus insularis]|uniref:vacuolar protein sorting-associated protein VTA1 homolog isoform X2 n=1 Tax=Chelonus insularis TaxID=460826 RepID=UPI00158B26F0|nr:vacuolar protein sorting-associated protein VTA1 homolog isoform X2 [Chelonus insularis]
MKFREYPKSYRYQCDLPEIPASYKSIQHYLKIAQEHDSRDPVVSYWARLYAAQTALGLSRKKTPEETAFLISLMNWLEETKKELRDNEAITNEVAAQAHLENWALKLFLYADKNDRASNFSKNVIQSFYTAGMLYDVITIFGELTEEAAQNRKYAKWKASYIHNCLKNGETPVPGPLDQNNDNPAEPENKDDFEDLNQNESNVEPKVENETVEPSSDQENEEANVRPPADNSEFSSVPHFTNSADVPSTPQTPSVPSSESNIFNPTLTPTTPPIMPDYSSVPQTGATTTGNVNLSSEQMLKAQKYIKWAGSAINYEDITTAVENLQKALHLLTTGQDT